jgi:hypothetical protein
MGDRVTGALIRWWGLASSPQEFHTGAAVATMEARERDDPRTVATKPRRPLGPRKPRRDPRRTSPDSAQAPPWRELQTARPWTSISNSIYKVLKATATATATSSSIRSCPGPHSNIITASIHPTCITCLSSAAHSAQLEHPRTARHPCSGASQRRDLEQS